MHSILDIQKRLLPDLLAVMQERYTLLKTINFLQPVGRRTLAATLGYSERVLRGEVDFLKDQNLIISHSGGMSLSEEGKNLLEDLESLMRELKGIDVMEMELKHRLGIRKAIIVPGDSDLSPMAKKEMGRAAVKGMRKLLKDKNIIAVTGGSTMAAVAEEMKPGISKEELMFVPARGGIGEDVQNQANTVCAIMAANTKSRHRVFYVPDQVSQDIYESFIREPVVHEVLALIKSAGMVLHGIGDAITMAERRKTDRADMEKIIAHHAVAEAFGYYFNEQGEIVHKVLTIGLQLDDLNEIPNVLAVAGGSSKAKAIRSYLKQAPPQTILITDEGAAKLLLKNG
ncbi:sugar-binding transcriptional regulator [Bacillus sp. B-jedd]|uniref:sugar-binding transcriptional regulator n=1 Tax=Bacillus sp. B-jedd TaxID=1476857 RepID=UPI0005156E60|nr:sugar-binding domain-containing protein [Bacillus sp. B-jedd]CEG28962.1 DeoR family transcriptional regulator [Bacillus sp. B-jedd]